MLWEHQDAAAKPIVRENAERALIEVHPKSLPGR
jgi:hypothetical protein